MTKWMWVVLLALFPLASGAQDLDRDTLPDAVEQELLERFAPSLMISGAECDGLPSEFQRDSEEPRATARNGTIYGQAFRNGSAIELHYYHLWSRDCGSFGHGLDVEHVSALIVGGQAKYWYAAAHEDTVCDASSGAKAAALDALDRGPVIWVSAAKHGSFLSAGKCRLGCGSDACRDSTAMPAARPINIGERGASLNGALWIRSEEWPLASKMERDFTAETIAQIENGSPSDGIVQISPPLPPTKEIILGGNRGLGGVLTGGAHSGRALGTGLASARGAVAATGRSLKKFLGLKRKEETSAAAEQ